MIVWYFEEGGMVLWRGWYGTLKRVMWYFEEGGMVLWKGWCGTLKRVMWYFFVLKLNVIFHCYIFSVFGEVIPTITRVACLFTSPTWLATYLVFSVFSWTSTSTPSIYHYCIEYYVVLWRGRYCILKRVMVLWSGRYGTWKRVAW